MESYLKKELGYTSVKRGGKGGGGCISEGEMYLTDRGKIFVKSNQKSGARAMFEGEFASLKAIEETGTVRVPHPIAVLDNPEGPGSILVMEYLDMKYLSNQAKLGTQLAHLHLHNQKQKENDNEATYVDKYGFAVATCCGYLPQSNAWDADWPTFYTNKLQEQFDRLKGSSDHADVASLWSRLKERIPGFFKDVQGSIFPALLHGDLWSGNASQTESQPVIFDAASFYGHHEYDLAIAGMFGGFDRDFYSAYHTVIPKSLGFETRHSLYQLFHHLNHWNHFGSSYKSSSLRIMRTLIA